MRMSRRLCVMGGGPLILFDGSSGGDRSEITGGWRHSSESQYTSSITMSSSAITCKHVRNDQAYNYHLMYTNKLFDLSAYRYLHVLSRRNPGGTYCIPRFGGVNTISTAPYFEEVVGKNTATGTTLTETVLDIRNYTDVCRIGILQVGALNISTTQYTYFTKIWLE